MRRRPAAVAVLSALVLLVAAPAALAAGVAVVEPSDTVRGATPLRVELTRDSRVEPISRARARLSLRGEVIGDWVDLACKERCGDDRIRQVWGPADDRDLDPATGAPFRSGSPLRNGEYEVEVRVERGRFLDPVEGTDRIRLAVPPSAPGDVEVSHDGDEVVVTWRRAPEPDVTGYRVERRDDDRWGEVRTTAGTRHADDPGPGTHAYRVVALREDGRGGTLETASSPREIEIEEPEADDDGADRDRARDGDRDDDAPDEGSGDGREGGDGAEDGDDGADRDRARDGDRDDDGDGDEVERRRRGSSGTARAPSLGSDRSGGIPSVFGRTPETADPDAFSEELDFGNGDANGDGNDNGDDVVVATPGGLRGSFDRAVDAERIATPIAVGLVLTATGLHLWRWLRVPGL